MKTNWNGAILRDLRQRYPRASKAEGSGKWRDCPNQFEFGELLGVSGRTVRRWENDEGPIPEPVQRLLDHLNRRHRNG